MPLGQHRDAGGRTVESEHARTAGKCFLSVLLPFGGNGLRQQSCSAKASGPTSTGSPGLPSWLRGLDSAARSPGPQWPAAAHVCMLLPQPLGEARSARLELTERGRQTRGISDHSVSTFQVLLPDAESMQAEKLELPLCSPSGPERTGRHGGPVGPS